jgi:hypothetical protein
MNAMQTTVRMLAIVLMTMGSAGGVPSIMNYQGRLLDSEGRPLNTNVTVSIALHTNDTGGAAVYAEDIGSVAVQNGIYGFHFGTNAPAVSSALRNPECWLEVTVDATTLSPRHLLVATPYAVRSSEVEGSEQWDEAYGWGNHATNNYLSADTSLLEINGTIRAKEVVVTLDGWPDYVFAPGYRLAPLDEVAAFIEAHGHLPGVPAAGAVARRGVSLGDMQKRLLEKVEELTLHLIRLERENRALRERLETLAQPGN